MAMKKKSGMGYGAGMGKGKAANKMPKSAAKKAATSKTKRGYNARTTMAQEKSRMMRRRSR